VTSTRCGYPGLPAVVRATRVPGVNGLDMHLLTAGERQARRGTVLLLHGFPELSFSWRHVMVPLADAGFYVVAPDQRGFGLTTGWDRRFEGDVGSFSAANLVEDLAHLLHRLEMHSVTTVVGHDFGSLVAARCALTRPAVFRSAVLMSAPIGPVAAPGALPALFEAVATGLAGLDPPREHYQCYFSGADAERDMLECEQGLVEFLRGYIHGKSGDFAENDPQPLGDMTPQALAQLPQYYVLRAGTGMARTVVRYHDDYVARGGDCAWLTDAELKVYADTFAATGFQGGLNWYRCLTGGIGEDSFAEYVGAPITVPAAFIAGGRDWGIHQTPGSLEAMQTRGCTDLRMLRLVPEAGHWIQQERPDAVVTGLVDFVDGLS
jgi:pimeloyl-ACP methyl ester carboxylesterase